MDRVLELLAQLRVLAGEDCRRGDPEACRLARELEAAMRALRVQTA